MNDIRRKDTVWSIEQLTWESVTVAVLMDLRDELQAIRAQLAVVVQCRAFLDIPRKLERIARNTAKPKSRGHRRRHRA